MTEFVGGTAAPGGSVTRRTAIVGVGAAAVGASVAACGSGGTPAESTPASAQPGTVLAKVADVPVGGGVVVGDTVVTQPVAGEFRGFSSVCPHQGCKVDRVSGGQIECPCHFSRFRLDGTVVSGPAQRSLAAKAVRVDGTNIVSA
ncbi:QcrA and Rieske domain-containing protein [Nocardia stercoris]|uniref:Cytochrome bc1 complex Rieske iron-sulfur subunit n=1 Tax=Nocardia stercoris TaxID=2483361 RepID=A0A3M2LIG8_9NOCA|nr:Rieske (2Fe-2S) protein [Nocardia stercoris]RMI35815.1 Rieske (2Fe-2S) protein [Nocardia stercoris]